MSVLLETDGRKRISLARLGAEQSEYYIAERRDDGSILLVPAEVRPKVLDVIERVAPNWRDAVEVTDVSERSEWAKARANSEQPDG